MVILRMSQSGSGSAGIFMVRSEHIFLTIWKLIELICGEPATDFILKRSMALRAWGYYLAVGIARFSFSPLLLLGNISFLEEDLFFMGVPHLLRMGTCGSATQTFPKTIHIPAPAVFGQLTGNESVFVASCIFS
jgi:hypothetical protein